MKGKGNFLDGETQEIGIDGDEEEPQRPFLRGEEFDIEIYASIYWGRAKIMRLLFIADRYSGDAQQTLQLEILRMAYDEAKKGEDVELLAEVVKKIHGRLGPKYEMDEDWRDMVNGAAKPKKEHLEYRLDVFKEDYLTVLTWRNDELSESARLAYKAFGDFYYAHGALDDAIKSYLDGLDYCTSADSYVDILINVTVVYIGRGQFHQVAGYVQKGEKFKDVDPIACGKLRCVLGLAYLEAKRFKSAADKFLEVSLEMGSQFLEVIAPQDIAIYGGLCALATFDRTELKKKVMGNVNFHSYLDSVIEVRELISDYYSSRYSSCFKYLESLKERLLHDIHFHDHFEILYDQIRRKALLLYIHPFVRLDLQKMAHAFRTSVEALEQELKDLINTNQVEARMDMKKRVLQTQRADQRNAAFQRVLQSCSVIERDVRSMLLEANLVRKHYYLHTGLRRVRPRFS